MISTLGRNECVVLAAEVAVQPVLLPAVPHRLADRPAEDLDRLQRREDGLRPERLDHRDDLDHAPRTPLEPRFRPRRTVDARRARTLQPVRTFAIPPGLA